MPDQFFIPALIDVNAPPRGAGTQAARQFFAQSVNASFAWGSGPGTATIVYIGDAPVTKGAQVLLTIGAHFFAGLCESDTLDDSSGGRTRTLQFKDVRDYLTWDVTWCAFNKEVRRLVNGVRQKRYRHIYPADWQRQVETYSTQPLTAAQMVRAILEYRTPGGTIGTPWAWDFTSRGEFPSGVLNGPVYDFDASGGKRLDAALNEISERTGTLFTVFSTPENFYQLVWTRKGYGSVPAFPADSDDRHVGEALAGNPTNVRVVGDRNRYLVMDVPLVPDWSRAWDAFLHLQLLAEDLFTRATDPVSGSKYNALAGDTRQTIGRNLAMERALRITVWEYAELRGDASFQDYRLFAGRPRNDMPAALYIQTLLFRAFKPDLTGLTNRAGDFIPLNQLALADQQVCAVSHDPVTGAMTAYPDEPAEGNGYAITKGFQVGEELLRQIKPDQFDVNFFAEANTNRLWSTSSFQLDNSGEGDRFIIFDTAIFVTTNLMLKNAGTNNLAVINAEFTLTVPAVKAALTFEAERYASWWGVYPAVSRDTVENVASLRMECVLQNGKFTEIPYDDGGYAADKAYQIANALLQRQYVVTEGGYKHYWNPLTTAPAAFGTNLSSMVDRVQITTGANTKTCETVDFTNERGRDHFEPERDLERRTLTNTLFPGQAELRTTAEQYQKLALALRQMPSNRIEAFARFLQGELQPGQLSGPVWFKPRAGGIAAGTKIIAGTPIWGSETSVATYSPDVVRTVDKLLLGVTVRENEPADKAFPVCNTGYTLARVMGPVSENDPIGASASAPGYLIKDGTPNCGKALGKITAAEVKLIPVQLGAGGGGVAATAKLATLLSVAATTLSVQTASGETLTVAKPFALRNPASETVDGVVISYSYSTVTERQAQIAGLFVETQIVLKRYVAGGKLIIFQPDNTDIANVVWMDANVDARAWARKFV